MCGTRGQRHGIPPAELTQGHSPPPPFPPLRALWALDSAQGKGPSGAHNTAGVMGVPCALSANLAPALSVGILKRLGVMSPISISLLWVGVFICSKTVFKRRAHCIQSFPLQLLAHGMWWVSCGWWFWA